MSGTCVAKQVKLSKCVCLTQFTHSKSKMSCKRDKHLHQTDTEKNRQRDSHTERNTHTCVHTHRGAITTQKQRDTSTGRRGGRR